MRPEFTDSETAVRVALPAENDRSAFRAAVQAVWDELDADLAERGPTCVNRGLCCQFGRFGHRLYVTEAEAAFFALTQPPAKGPAAGGLAAIQLPVIDDGPALPDRCPYQVDGQCTARDARPLGCRVYFCDADSEAWHSAIYEPAHTSLRKIGADFGLPYRYRDWMTVLAALPPENAMR